MLGQGPGEHLRHCFPLTCLLSIARSCGTCACGRGVWVRGVWLTLLQNILSVGYADNHPRNGLGNPDQIQLRWDPVAGVIRILSWDSLMLTSLALSGLEPRCQELVPSVMKNRAYDGGSGHRRLSCSRCRGHSRRCSGVSPIMLRAHTVPGVQQGRPHARRFLNSCPASAV